MRDRSGYFDRTKLVWGRAFKDQKVDPFGRVRSPEIGLGLSLRAHILRSLAVSPKTLMPSVEELAEWSKGSPDGVKQNLRAALPEKINMRAWKAVAKAVLADLKGQIPALASITAEDLASEPFGGPGAAEEYRLWLLGKGLPPKPNVSFLGRLEDWTLQESAGRTDLTTAVRQFLRDRTIGPDRDGGILRVLTGGGMPDGLRAFASHIIREFGSFPSDAGRPVCYLPVARDPITQDAITSDQLIGRLRGFCERSRNLKGAPCPRTPAERRADIEVIRRTMARSPFILVLDAWGCASGPMGRLNAVVDDDGLVELVGSLIYPARGPDASAIDADRFWQNRILILAENAKLPLTVPIGTASTFVLEPPSKDEVKALQVAAALPQTPSPPLTSDAARPEARSDPLKAADGIEKPADRQLTIDLLRFVDLSGSKLRTDAAVRLARDLLKRRHAGRPTPQEEIETLATGTFDELVGAWITELRKDPLCLLAVFILALARDNTRKVTLERLLERWQVAAREDFEAATAALAASKPTPPPGNGNAAAGVEAVASWCAATPGADGSQPIDIPASLPQALESLAASRLIITGQDTPLPGWDDVAGAPSMERLAYVNLFSETLRLAIVDRIVGNEPAMLVARMHRLLADEALFQYSTISRNDLSNDASNVRYFRRLIQGIYHGYSSLSEGPDFDDSGLKRLEPRFLPTNPIECYRRIYSVFYRGLMERPPSWELSRVLGREDLKVDLLFLAMTCGPDRDYAVPESSSADEPLFPSERGKQRPAFRADDAGGLRIAFDQYLALARAAYHNAQTKTAAAAVLDAEAVLLSLCGGWPEGGDFWPSRFLREAIDLAKVVCDLAVLRSASDAEETIARQLRRLRFEDNLIRDLQDLDREEPLETLTPRIDACALLIYEHAKTLVHNGEHPTEASGSSFDADGMSVLLSAWSDLLSRFGEASAQKTLSQPQSLLQADGLRRAFVFMRLAERIRREAFKVSPLTRDYYVNGHATRALIRIALDLHQLLQNPADRALLAGQAKRHLEMLTRYLARYPTEKASLLVLEAAYLRQCGNDGAPDLVGAEAALDRADVALQATLHRPRVYLRLLFERAKTYEARIARRGFSGHGAALYRGAVERALELDKQMYGRLSVRNPGETMWQHLRERLG